MKVKKGEYVTRKSYGNDIVFVVDRIINLKDGNALAILKGVTFRVEADAPLQDIEKVDESRVINSKKEIDKMLIERINNYKKQTRGVNIKTGRILHLDGDKRYSEKTEKYYKKSGLNYIVKHVAEHKQPNVVTGLLQRYKPDILVITGHDGMIKKGKNYSDINNYRNSKYFMKAVIEARSWNRNIDDLVIFAGACQSYYEALINAGANFASSPARILIDFMDPLVVAEEISKAPKNKIIFISDIETKIRNGRKAVNGIGARGKKG